MGGQSHHMTTVTPVKNYIYFGLARSGGSRLTSLCSLAATLLCWPSAPHKLQAPKRIKIIHE